MILEKNEIDKERMHGKIIMAIKIIRDQNKLAPYVHSSEVPVSEDILACWMDVSQEVAGHVMSLCYTLAPEVLVWAVIREQKYNSLSIEQARKSLVEKIEEKVLYAEEHYNFPFDVIKYAMPISLIAAEKGIKEDNIENMCIINSMAFDICEGIKRIGKK